MSTLLTAEFWAAFVTLTALEIVLGIDNIIFLSIISGRVAAETRKKVQRIGLMLALVLRVALLSGITWLASLTAPLIEISGFAFSWRDLVLGSGGFFLLYKGTVEIHGMVEGDPEAEGGRRHLGMAAAIIQIMALDIVFSLDSVITAVGMTDHLGVMIAAIVVAIGIMMFAAQSVGDFVNRHPTVKMLALGFLLLVGVALIADAGHFHIPRGYIYSAIAFSALIETLNLLVRRKGKAPAAK